MCLSLGMVKFAPRPTREFREDVSLVDVQHLLEVLKIELILLIPCHQNGENDDRIEEKIEEMCESLGIAYQSCYPSERKETLKSFARKIQRKVVKRLVRLQRLELPLVREAPTMIFDADMVHVDSSKSGCIASVVASLDWPKFRKYFGVASYQPYNKGIIKDLYTSSGVMINFFNSFYKKIKERPKRLIFFRHGLQEGQFGYICQQEIDAIKQVCASVKEGYPPPSLTYVVVLHIESWTGTINGNVHIHRTEPDPTMYKLLCHHTTEEISDVIRYCVVHDDNNFPPW